jgi:hypothetical protein
MRVASGIPEAVVAYSSGARLHVVGWMRGRWLAFRAPAIVQYAELCWRNVLRMHEQ